MLDWQNGQLYSTRFGDVYFSRDSGLEEKHYVFLQGNRLADRFESLQPDTAFSIGETGFGTGLSFLCTWRLFIQIAPLRTSLDFFSVEKYPLDEKELSAALALWPELGPYADELMLRWQRRVPGWNRWSFAGGRVRLTLAIEDVTRALPETHGIDAWFLDGFSPARNPEMWTLQIFHWIARASRAGATFATYTSAGVVRRGLEQAGFQVKKISGFGHKREMLQGDLPGPPPVRLAPTTAIVIGGGIAGCAAASALASRGLIVELLESHTLGAGASGNPIGILHARLSAGMNALHRFVLASYGHALALLDEKIPVDGVMRSECGELQLSFSAEEARRIGKLATLDWPAHVFRPVDAAEASALAGIELSYGGLWFPGSGWLAPPQLCVALLGSQAITLYTGRTVKSLTPTSHGWRVQAEDQRKQAWSLEAEIVVVCTGYQVKSLPALANLPLTPVRGQLTLIPATTASQNLRTIVCGSGYFSPAVAGRHMVGATHRFNDTSINLNVWEHAENLSRLREISPVLRRLSDEVSQDIRQLEQLDGRTSIRGSVPGAMPLVGELLPGLYTSLGHGTRGLITAGISAESVAATACGQLLPLPLSVVNALSPVRRASPAIPVSIKG
ncbi:bifunctional tRNA (5-methylaminomethyl-2-thiouridine)(34)-methyltransferase MnmD/FAD-dependent 5-carboxymethylaminomethyl-2-thiouridine(34) oxidoreductase MnmC [Nitrosospira multiformis]|uniref:bifunctional tRNA (5-methylaminomethyl-2-thiouridine)(34)-methyltransferase MnmD/FAD-dependent 5-carboxymethylaminomethyl-2-thiouridine(34) oxidoreductase MnmC n=1 Tax=Nitrosospira multiformis TaxID=1231 RepID=UPI00089528BE|nr:bifunctional tRNA (5-methylaminomethyl-2-thiouridine)(34)-methyltransferase MnmD/FAD-dependent 5-carboxymethylaminomethyl-2-thiouridine(34) oxidoreductase MnmC [Nitrosospira multiformis]SDZ95817.1 tRNA 5-methylaminomethyl-2-thiouridine biosynthesis bifunctional protein [Nitrosospira multiformis]